MKTKWYLSTFIFILTLLGIGLQKNSNPNQEIVVQFANPEASSTNSQQTIAIVTQTLQNIGAAHIQIHQGDNSKLKITYFSTVDVTSIKRILSNKKEFVYGFASLHTQKQSSKIPFRKDSSNFQLDVFEIQKNQDLHWDFNTNVLKITHNNEHFFNPSLPIVALKINVHCKNNIEKISYLTQRNISILIDNLFRQIPEVRAGPFLIA